MGRTEEEIRFSASNKFISFVKLIKCILKNQSNTDITKLKEDLDTQIWLLKQYLPLCYENFYSNKNGDFKAIEAYKKLWDQMPLEEFLKESERIASNIRQKYEYLDKDRILTMNKNDENNIGKMKIG